MLLIASAVNFGLPRDTVILIANNKDISFPGFIPPIWFRLVIAFGQHSQNCLPRAAGHYVCLGIPSSCEVPFAATEDIKARHSALPET